MGDGITIHGPGKLHPGDSPSQRWLDRLNGLGAGSADPDLLRRASDATDLHGMLEALVEGVPHEVHELVTQLPAVTHGILRAVLLALADAGRARFSVSWCSGPAEVGMLVRHDGSVDIVVSGPHP